jgi:Zn ribbon nucleic-acid-binding protein
VGKVQCKKCGKVWDYQYVHYELPFTERHIFIKGLGCPDCSDREPVEMSEEEKAIMKIVESLNDITGRCQTLEKEMRNAKKGGILPVDKAYQELDSFFYRCQVAENHIKTALKNGYIHEVDRNHLNKELGAAVDTMIALARRSILYHHVMKDLAENKPAIAEIIQPHLSPADRPPQFLGRRYRTSDIYLF